MFSLLLKVSYQKHETEIQYKNSKHVAIKQYTFINSKEKSQKGTKNAENGMK